MGRDVDKAAFFFRIMVRFHQLHKQDYWTSMELTFLGTGSALPTLERNVSSLLLSRNGEITMFDCGEGTQHQLLHTRARRSRIRRIVITHLHGDHYFGLIGLLSSFQLNQRIEPLHLMGPPGLREYLDFMLNITEKRFNFPVEIQEIQPGNEPAIVHEASDYHLEAVQLNHRIYTMGFALVENRRPGKFDGEKAHQLGIPNGPERRLLKEGHDITLADGRVIHSSDLVEPPLPGRKIVYITDTTWTPNSVKLARNADLLIHESTYDAESREHARRTMHSTLEDAIRVAREAEVRQLVVTHISSRYIGDTRRFVEQISQRMPEAKVARDFLRIQIGRLGESEFRFSRPRRRMDDQGKE